MKKRMDTQASHGPAGDALIHHGPAKPPERLTEMARLRVALGLAADVPESQVLSDAAERLEDQRPRYVRE